MFLLLSNSDGLGDPKLLYPSEFILAIPPPHVNRQITQIPPFFLAIVPKHNKSPGGAGQTPSVKPCGFATSLSEGGSGETGSFAAGKGSLFEGAVAAGDWGSLP